MEYIGTTGKVYKTVEPAVGKGGEGSVYRLVNFPNHVLKIFRDNKRSETRHKKLLAMLATPLSKDAMKQITWPVDVVYENGYFAGYVMPEIKNNEDLNVMYSDKYTCTLSEKITIAKNLCAAINSVHEANQVCGDLNPKNICVDPNCALVTLVDTDSYHISEANSSRVYRCEVGLPEYLPREIQVKMKNGQTLATAPLPTFTKQSDLFALAVHIFALLMNGCHPFACAVDNKLNINHLSISQASVVAPQPIDNICSGFFPFCNTKPGITTPKYAPTFDYLPQYIQELFVRAFVKGHTDPYQRPDAVEWYTALSAMQKDLTTCNKDSHHMFPSHNTVCPWCHISTVMNTVNRRSSSVGNVIKQTSINTNPHYATHQPQNNSSSSNKQVSVSGKIIGIVIGGIIAALLLRSCFGGSSGSSTSHGYGSGSNNQGGSFQTEQPAKPPMETINVPSIVENSLSIESIVPNSKTNSPTEFLTYNGNISANGQQDEYTYTAVCGGRVRFEISNLYSGTAVELYVLNTSGERVGSETYCTNGEGVTLIGIESGQTYIIHVRQTSGYSNYTLTIGQPKQDIDISGLTEIQDSIEFTDQRNVYTFTAPRDGRYRFDVSGITSGCAVELYVFNSLGESLGSDTYCTNGEGITLIGLTAGEVYTVNVRYSVGYTNYTLAVGSQKPIVDASSLTRITDSIEYTDQRNVYSFSPSVDGRYRFDIDGLRSGCAVELFVFNSLGESLDSDTYCTNGEGITLRGLDSNETYEVQVRQSSGLSSYSLNIGIQKPSTSVKSNVIVNDNIEYADQRNVYEFTAEEAGTHTFTISGLSSGCAVELYAFNELGETIASETYCKNGEKITLNNLYPGEAYEIQVRQSSGLSSYKLTIEAE